MGEVIDESCYDFVVLTETWLKLGASFDCQEYQVFRYDRDARRGGGVLIAVRKSLKAFLRPVQYQNLEQVVVEVALPEETLYILGVYLAPSSGLKMYKYHVKTIEQLFEVEGLKTVILLGDYNCPDLKWTPEQHIPHYKMSGEKKEKSNSVRKLLEYGLFQKNVIKNKNMRILDLVLTNKPNNVLVEKAPEALRHCDIHHEPLLVSYESP